MISYLAIIDSSYIDLMKSLADGVVNNLINDNNNLVWRKVDSETGIPNDDENYGYESQLSNYSL